MKGKKSFVLYTDLLYTIEKLPPEKAGELFLHVLKYVNDQNPQTNDIVIQIAFEPIKQQLKRDLEKYQNIVERNKSNGLKGGRPKKPKKPNGLIENPTKPRKADNDTDTDNDNDNDIKRKRKHLFKNSPYFDYQKFQDKILKDEKYSCFDIQYYFEAVKNWSSGGAQMKVDWISTTKNWMLRDAKEGKAKTHQKFENNGWKQWLDENI